jgi:DHA1 family multidrug resistance protein-like MFS transporter
MGLSNSFVSLGRIIGPLLAGFVFDLNIQLPYLTGAAVMGAGFIISLFVLGRNWHHRPLANI